MPTKRDPAPAASQARQSQTLNQTDALFLYLSGFSSAGGVIHPPLIPLIEK
jgi:hypothetical protein